MQNTRLAEPIDLAAVMAFDAFPGDRIVEILERRMLVVEVDDRIQGYASWQNKGCIGKDYVNKLIVNEAYRRRGLAKRLIDALNTVLSGRVFISAPANNVAAIELLQVSQWTYGGNIVGILDQDEAEVFFYKDLTGGLEQ